MERLTETSDKGGLAFTFDLDIACNKNEIEKIIKLGKKLKEYEDLEEQGLLIKLPCRIGDSIFIIGKCNDFPDRLDGGYWDATGYYCPYEDSELCPFLDCEDCNSVKDKLGVFEDTIIGIHIEEDNTYLIFENGIGKYLSDFGNTVFTTREEAENKLNNMK